MTPATSLPKYSIHLCTENTFYKHVVLDNPNIHNKPTQTIRHGPNITSTHLDTNSKNTRTYSTRKRSLHTFYYCNMVSLPLVIHSKSIIILFIPSAGSRGVLFCQFLLIFTTFNHSIFICSLFPHNFIQAALVFPACSLSLIHV